MYKKIINTFFLISLFTLIFLVFRHYLSEKNVILINKSRSSFSWMQIQENMNLPILVNDTHNIIIYRNDLEEFKKKRKKRIWEKLISNDE